MKGSIKGLDSYLGNLLAVFEALLGDALPADSGDKRKPSKQCYPETVINPLHAFLLCDYIRNRDRSGGRTRIRRTLLNLDLREDDRFSDDYEDDSENDLQNPHIFPLQEARIECPHDDRDDSQDQESSLYGGLIGFHALGHQRQLELIERKAKKQEDDESEKCPSDANGLVCRSFFQEFDEFIHTDD